MQMIDEIEWEGWNVPTETIMTIQKFKSIWIKTKESHPNKDFRVIHYYSKIDEINKIIDLD